MIYFDVTKTGSAGHRSGLTRVSSLLRQHLGAAATDVTWTRGALIASSGKKLPPLTREDWFLTSELFSEEERPGFSEFLASPSRPCRVAAIYHDAIPLKHPHITWPKSVARHPVYLKLLACFDHVWAVSQASRDELLGFWSWQGVEHCPPVDPLALGADFDGAPRAVCAPLAAANASDAPDKTEASPRPQLLCLGIIEPRKNQSMLMETCDQLWRERLDFELHVVGRVNPHFGPPIVARLKMLRREHKGRLEFHEAASDANVANLYASARATIFPTIAEGCGLPLLESLWRGVPCVCSDLPVLRENADGGGCLPVPVNDFAAWKSALRKLVADDALHARLSGEARTRPLPTWREAAETLRRRLAE